MTMKRTIFQLMLIIMALATSQLWAEDRETTRRETSDRDQVERVLRSNRQLKREALRRIEALREAIEAKEELLREQRAEIRVLERRHESTSEAVAQKDRIEQELRTLRSDLEAL